MHSGQLINIFLLLPNLISGGDFGLTSFLVGMYRMFHLGLMTPEKKSFMRGVDGGSENVNKTTLAMNNLLVKLGIFDCIQQHRLPPDHSHRWTTDGLFSVIEGWLTKDGFKGCKTVWELIEYLRAQFAKADGYKDKQARARGEHTRARDRVRNRAARDSRSRTRQSLARLPSYRALADTYHVRAAAPSRTAGGNFIPPHQLRLHEVVRAPHQRQAAAPHQRAVGVEAHVGQGDADGVVPVQGGPERHGDL